MAATYKIKLTYMRASEKDLPDIARTDGRETGFGNALPVFDLTKF